MYIRCNSVGATAILPLCSVFEVDSHKGMRRRPTLHSRRTRLTSAGKVT